MLLRRSLFSTFVCVPDDDWVNGDGNVHAFLTGHGMVSADDTGKISTFQELLILFRFQLRGFGRQTQEGG